MRAVRNDASFNTEHTQIINTFFIFLLVIIYFWLFQILLRLYCGKEEETPQRFISFLEGGILLIWHDGRKSHLFVFSSLFFFFYFLGCNRKSRELLFCCCCRARCCFFSFFLFLSFFWNPLEEIVTMMNLLLLLHRIKTKSSTTKTAQQKQRRKWQNFHSHNFQFLIFRP